MFDIDIRCLIRDTAFVAEPFLRKYNGAVCPSAIEVKEHSDLSRLSHSPSVSVVVLAYNCAPYLEECIDSIRMQQMNKDELEIIISEDGSTDSTLAVAFSLQEKYPDLIRVIYANANVGLIKNFCRAFDFCRGQYIAYTDGDDYFCDRQKLSKQVECLNKEIDVVMVYTGAVVQLERYKLFRTRITRKTKRSLLRMNEMSVKEFCLALFKKDPIVANTPVFRKSAILYAISRIKNLYNCVDWFPCQDFEAYFYIATQGKVRFIEDDTSVHRVYGGSQSGNPDDFVAIARGVGDARVKLAMVAMDNDLFPESIKEWAVVNFLSRLCQYLALKGDFSVLTTYIKSILADLDAKLPEKIRKCYALQKGDELAREIKESRWKLKWQQSFIYFFLKSMALKLFGL